MVGLRSPSRSLADDDERLSHGHSVAVDLINAPTNGFAPGFLSLTGNAAPEVPAGIQCMVTNLGTDEKQVQVMLWSGTGEDYSVVIVLTNGLEIMNTSTSSFGTLFGDAATSEEEFPPPTVGTPCTVASDWTISVCCSS